MGVNKIILNGENLIDLTGVTINSAYKGKIFHTKYGDRVEGKLNKNIAMGSITLASDIGGASTSSFTITHNLGVVPSRIIVWAATDMPDTYTMLASLFVTDAKNIWRAGHQTYNWYHGTSDSSVSASSLATSSAYRASVDEYTATFKSHSSSYMWKAGTYYWMTF